MNKANVEFPDLHYGDIFYDEFNLFLVSNPEQGKAALINLESGMTLAQGDLKEIDNIIRTNKLSQVPIGTRITLTVK
jgi:hypothetical protein